MQTISCRTGRPSPALVAALIGASAFTALGCEGANANARQASAQELPPLEVVMTTVRSVATGGITRVAAVTEPAR
ncbi:MAG: hypothetical protein H5U40_03935, partial [Polyangiaceae bacterium]|nr:hypothetical protein [Polyangiaceae bacterium]